MSDETSTQVRAEIDGTRIYGHAVHGGRFNVPIFTEVGQVKNGALWVGGTPAENPALLTSNYWDETVDEEHIGTTPLFDKILCLYPWESYAVPEGTERLSVEMYDDLDQATDQVDELAQQVLHWLLGGHTVLIHCQAGLNRSNLVAARTLMLSGQTADEAISSLREKRSREVLCNSAFENWLRSI